jgi:SAM-dependent methyltransferase
MAQRLVREVVSTWRAGGVRSLARRVAERLAFERGRLRGRVVESTAQWQQIHAAGGMGAVLQALRRRLRYRVLRATGRRQTEAELIDDSRTYWNEGDKAGVDLGDFSHWLGAGPWSDRERWLKLGRVHHRMFERLCLVAGVPRPVRRVIEWGSGGGANAIHFIGEAHEFCGVEIAQASLDACERVLQDAGYGGFKPVLIDAAGPEAALDLAGGGYDFFLSTYVFELLPGRAYGERVLATALRLLRPGGVAIVQIRYDDGSVRSRQHHLDYYSNSTRFTSWRVEEFWTLAERIGFRAEYVTLVPRRTEDYSGDLYAYFALVKPDDPVPRA